MEKHIYLLRHAKSSWKDLTIPDFDRPLNKRGKRDAPKMGKLLGKMGVSPDLIISSPAKRTKETISIISKEIHFREKIFYNENIYDSSADELLNIIKAFDEKFNRVLLVGHNPSLTDLVNYLSKDKIDNIPTCGIVGLTFNCSWQNLSDNCCDTIFFEYFKKNDFI